MGTAKNVLRFRNFMDEEKRWLAVPCADWGSLMETMNSRFGNYDLRL